MIVRDREPVVYTSNSTDWSAVSIILAIAVVALLGFLMYYFTMLHAESVLNQPPVVQHDVTPVVTPVPVPVTQPAPAPTTVVIPAPQPAPQPVPQTSTPSNTATQQPSDSSSDTTSN